MEKKALTTEELPVLCAKNLVKKDFFRLPDPFAKVVVDGSGQCHSTDTVKNTLDPKWNQHYDLQWSETCKSPARSRPAYRKEAGEKRYNQLLFYSILKHNRYVRFLVCQPWQCPLKMNWALAEVVGHAIEMYLKCDGDKSSKIFIFGKKKSSTSIGLFGTSY